MRKTLFLVVIALAGVAGCKSEKKEAPAAAKVEPAPAPTPVAPEPVKKLGLAEPTNNPTIVAAAKKAVADCGPGWSGKKGFEWDCASYKAWNEQQVEWGKNDATFVSMAEDEDEKIRYLGITGLSRWGGEGYKTDKALAERLVAALEVEHNDAVDGILAATVATTQLETLGLLPRVATLLEKADDDVRHGVLYNVFTGSPGSETGYQLVTKALARTQNKEEQRNLFQALSGSTVHTDEICKTWVGFLDHADPSLAGEAAARLTRAHRSWSSYDSDSNWSTGNGASIEGANPCAATVDDVLARIEAQATGGKLTSSESVDALRGVLDDQAAAQPQKDKALAIARAGVENTANQVRSSALWLLVEKAPDGKTYALTFKGNADSNLNYVAEQVAKQP